MFQLKYQIIKIIPMLIGGLLVLASCNRLEDEMVIPCTYLSDPDCFCGENPNHPLCGGATGCTFEEDPVCYCQENPEDELCNMEGGEIAGALWVYYDHFEGQDPNAVFESGYIPDNPNGWHEKADPNPSIKSDGAAIGNDYLAVEIEIIEAGWAWTGNLFYSWVESEGVSFDAGNDPYLNFYVRTADAVPFQFEGAFGGPAGESGFQFKFEGAGDWQYYSLKMSTLDWKWGDGVDVNAIDYIKWGYNIDGFEVGDIPEIHIDGMHISSTPPVGATVIDQAQANVAHTYFDFENVEDVSTIFVSGYIPDNPDGWHEKGAINATVESGDAPQGDKYLNLEIEVVEEGWAWLGNLFSEESLDFSGVSDPHFNFYIRTAEGEPFQIESAFADAVNGESGFNIDKNLINGDWQLMSIKIEAINWLWGGTLDLSQLNVLKFGFNQDGYANEDIINVHVDNFTISSGPAIGADHVIEQN